MPQREASAFCTGEGAERFGDRRLEVRYESTRYFALVFFNFHLLIIYQAYRECAEEQNFMIGLHELANVLGCHVFLEPVLGLPLICTTHSGYFLKAEGLIHPLPNPKAC